MSGRADRISALALRPPRRPLPSRCRCRATATPPALWAARRLGPGAAGSGSPRLARLPLAALPLVPPLLLKTRAAVLPNQGVAVARHLHLEDRGRRGGLSARAEIRSARPLKQDLIGRGGHAASRPEGRRAGVRVDVTEIRTCDGPPSSELLVILKFRYVSWSRQSNEISTKPFFTSRPPCTLHARRITPFKSPGFGRPRSRPHTHRRGLELDLTERKRQPRWLAIYYPRHTIGMNHHRNPYGTFTQSAILWSYMFWSCRPFYDGCLNVYLKHERGAFTLSPHKYHRVGVW